jgi:hypothetical protein
MLEYVFGVLSGLALALFIGWRANRAAQPYEWRCPFPGCTARLRAGEDDELTRAIRSQHYRERHSSEMP